MALLGRFLNVDGSLLLFIPLAHVLARVIQVGAVKTRTVIGHTPDVKNLVEDLGEFQPTFVLAVPRVFEKVFNGAKAKAEAAGKGTIFDKAAQVAIDWSRAQDTGGPGIALRAQHALFDKLVYGKLRAALGGRCLGAISGGAPLGDRLGHFFRGIGVTVFEGYGLTETTAAASVNHDEALRIGTVGRPLPGVEAAIADDGEILIRGGIVMRGYWKNEEATKEAIDADGWFHSGDLGELDGDGFLKITGRKKEIIVTAGGKNVAPAVLEDRIRAHRLVSQCIVVGDQRPFIAALITLDEEALPGWLESKGKPADSTRRAAARRPGAARRARRGGQGGQQGGVPGRGDQEVPRAGGRLHRGQRDAHPEPEAQALRRHEGVRRRGRGPLRPLIRLHR